MPASTLALATALASATAPVQSPRPAPEPMAVEAPANVEAPADVPGPEPAVADVPVAESPGLDPVEDADVDEPAAVEAAATKSLSPRAARRAARKRRRWLRNPDWVAIELEDGHVALVEEPPTRGTGWLAAAGVVGGLAFVQHAVVVGVFNGTCGVVGDAAAESSMMDEEMTDEEAAEEVAGLAALGVACAATVTPALIFRLGTPIMLGASLSMAAAGAGSRARSDAFRDRFGRHKTKRWKGITYDVLGGVLLATGISAWLSSRITLLGNRVGCSSIRCYTRYDFSTLHASAALTISGAAVLTYGLAYRKAQRHYGRPGRPIDLHLAPNVSRNTGGLSLSGRF